MINFVEQCYPRTILKILLFVNKGAQIKREKDVESFHPSLVNLHANAAGKLFNEMKVWIFLSTRYHGNSVVSFAGSFHLVGG